MRNERHRNHRANCRLGDDDILRNRIPALLAIGECDWSGNLVARQVLKLLQVYARLVGLARSLQRTRQSKLRRSVQWIDFQRLLKRLNGLGVIQLLAVERAEEVVRVWIGRIDLQYPQKI